MKIFISSVRGGLEAERDSLPGLIMALDINLGGSKTSALKSCRAARRAYEESKIVTSTFSCWGRDTGTCSRRPDNLRPTTSG
jgi:hypothetical protein